MSETIKGLFVAEFDYDATSAEELGVREGQWLFLLDDSDADWFKVRLKLEPGVDADASQQGLVPASYLSPARATGTAKANYGFEASNTEELTVVEDEELLLYANEEDWALVGRAHGEGVGYVPTSYLEANAEASAQDQEQLPHHEEPAHYDEPEPAEETGPAPTASTAAFAPPPLHPKRHDSVGEVSTWPASSVDLASTNRKKATRRKGTLGIGNGALFFTSESDKGPVQQVALALLNGQEFDPKAKTVELAFEDGTAFLFELKTKEAVGEVEAKLEVESEGRAARSSAPTPMPASTIAPPASAVASSGAAEERDGRLAIVQYDFSGEGEDELSVAENERVIVLNSTDPDWWVVEREHATMVGEQGVVPATFLEIADARALFASPKAPASSAPSIEEDDEAERLTSQAEALQIAQDRSAAEKLQRQEDRRARKEAERRELQLAQGIRFDSSSSQQARAPPMPPRGGSSSSGSNGGPPPPRSIPVPSPPMPVPPQLTKPPTPGMPEVQKQSGSSEKRGKPDARKIRVWKDRTGQFKVEAQFLGIENNKIRLHKSNGVVIDVPMEKMSPEDVKVIDSILGARSAKDPEADAGVGRDKERDRRHRSRRSSRDQTNGSSAAAPTQPPRPQQPKAPKVDWFDFFLSAGCDLDDCTRYAANFDRDRIDEEVLPDLEAATLRSLGLREGDVIRVRKRIKQKYGRSAALPPAAASEEAPAASGSLFTGPTGGLKTTRRGRPQASVSKQPSLISADSVAAATDQLAGASRVASPDLISQATSSSSSFGPGRRSSSTQPITSGFDDDAWTVKSPSKPNTPAPPPAQSTPAPAQPPIERAKSIAPASTVPLSESILASMGIGNRPPSAPVQSQYRTGSTASSGNMSASNSYQGQLAPNPDAPRGPVAPLAQNAPLLNPLIPTQTGFNQFIPTRPASGPVFSASQPQMMPQVTSFAPQAQQSLIPQATGYVAQQPTYQQQQPLRPQPTGFASQSVSLPQGMPSMQMAVQPQQTGYMQHQQASVMPQQTGYMQPQPTSMMAQQTGYMQAPGMFGQTSVPPVPALPAMFNPQPLQQAPASTPVDRYTPGNVFAAMKQGQKVEAMPQPEQRYDALRPQPTGFPQQTFGIPSQQTGFVQMQPTGMHMQNGMYRPAY